MVKSNNKLMVDIMDPNTQPAPAQEPKPVKTQVHEQHYGHTEHEHLLDKPDRTNVYKILALTAIMVVLIVCVLGSVALIYS